MHFSVMFSWISSKKYEIKNKQIHKIKEKILIFGTQGMQEL